MRLMYSIIYTPCPFFSPYELLIATRARRDGLYMLFRLVFFYHARATNITYLSVVTASYIFILLNDRCMGTPPPPPPLFCTEKKALSSMVDRVR